VFLIIVFWRFQSNLASLADLFLLSASFAPLLFSCTTSTGTPQPRCSFLRRLFTPPLCRPHRLAHLDGWEGYAPFHFFPFFLLPPFFFLYERPPEPSFFPPYFLLRSRPAPAVQVYVLFLAVSFFSFLCEEHLCSRTP